MFPRYGLFESDSGYNVVVMSALDVPESWEAKFFINIDLFIGEIVENRKIFHIKRITYTPKVEQSIRELVVRLRKENVMIGVVKMLSAKDN